MNKLITAAVFCTIPFTIVGSALARTPDETDATDAATDQLLDAQLERSTHEAPPALRPPVARGEKAFLAAHPGETTNWWTEHFLDVELIRSARAHAVVAIAVP